MTKYLRLLRTIGKKSFIDFYEDYRRIYLLKDRATKEDKLLLVRKLLENNPSAYKESGQLTRIHAAVSIFKNNWEREALNEVIHSKHPLITKDIKNKAIEYLKEA